MKQTSTYGIRIVGFINAVIGGVGVLVWSYGTVAMVVMLVRLNRSQPFRLHLWDPYLRALVCAMALPGACLMLASGIGLLREAAWARKATITFALYSLATVALTGVLYYVQGILRTADCGSFLLYLIYLLWILSLMLPKTQGGTTATGA